MSHSLVGLREAGKLDEDLFQLLEVRSFVEHAFPAAESGELAFELIPAGANFVGQFLFALAGDEDERASE